MGILPQLDFVALKEVKEVDIIADIKKTVNVSTTSSSSQKADGKGYIKGYSSATSELTDYPYTNPTVPIPYVLGVLFIIITLGTLIGLIPAQRAVSIKPIEALREE